MSEVWRKRNERQELHRPARTHHDSPARGSNTIDTFPHDDDTNTQDRETKPTTGPSASLLRTTTTRSHARLSKRRNEALRF